MVSFTIGQIPPALFDVGLLTNVTGPAAGGGASTDYNDDFRVRQTFGGAGDSGLIATSKATSTLGTVDVYFFQIANATPGNVFTVSGVENTANFALLDYHATLNGTLFPALSAVPEPSAYGLLGVIGLVVFCGRGLRW